MAKLPNKKFTISSLKDVLIADIHLPSSKSISNRAIILQEIVKNQTGKSVTLNNLSDADDTRILQDSLSIIKGSIDIKNAGTCLRFLTAFFAATEGREITITGSERMKERPIAPLVDALIQMGANIKYLEKEECIPIHIIGKKLNASEVTIPGDQSSQFISALLLISPLLQNNFKIKIESEIVSRDYINMTLHLITQFGFNHIFSPDHKWIQIEKNIHHNPLLSFEIEADWSSAAFFYQAALLAEKADIFFPRLNLESIQGDSILAKIMEQFGIKSIQKETGISISKGKIPTETSSTFNFIDCPDLAPAIVNATAGAGIPFCANGIQSLQWKESNRINALVNGLKLLHFRVQSTDSNLCHDGIPHAFYQNSLVDTANDHRITMAFAMLAIAQSQIVLNEIDSVQKSFPNFWIEAKKIGISVK
jgi:3-phosphoshikimate 1-carboxyvinyltransferase